LFHALIPQPMTLSPFPEILEVSSGMGAIHGSACSGALGCVPKHRKRLRKYPLFSALLCFDSKFMFSDVLGTWRVRGFVPCPLIPWPVTVSPAPEILEVSSGREAIHGSACSGALGCVSKHPQDMPRGQRRFACRFQSGCR